MWKPLTLATLLIATQAFADGGTPPVVLDSWVAVPGVILPAAPQRAYMFNEATGTEGARVWFPRGVRTEALAIPPAMEAPVAPALTEVNLPLPEMLPKTASTLSLIELAGLSSLAAALLIGRLRRHAPVPVKR